MTRFRQQPLKTVRVVSAVVFILLISAFIADPFHLIPPEIGRWLFALQIIPAITRSIVYGGISLAGLIILSLLTLLFGRVYCSAICPLGTLQDIVIRISRTFRRRKRFRFRTPAFRLHYGILAATAGFFILGSALPIDLLEPYSLFGKIIAHTLRPLAFWTVNGAVSLLALTHLGSPYSLPVRTILLPSFLYSFAALAALTYLSFNHGRLFCNTVCPAGALLGLFSRLSLFRIVIDKADCNACGKCERECKAECIDSPGQKISHAACVSCFNCIATCPTEAVRFEPRAFTKREIGTPPSPDSRRRFFQLLGPPLIAASLPLILTWQKNGKTVNGYFAAKTIPVAPPGAQSIAHYTSLCTACHLCVSSCPTQVLQPSFLEFGVGGMFQPQMNYAISYCNYDCTLCGEVCPTGAILPSEAVCKKVIQIGKATFVRDDCVVVSKKKDCAACSEHCPTKAVSTVPYEGSLMIPQLNNEICIGCGACEHACPVQPRKAIFVTSNIVHQKAKRPPEQHRPAHEEELKVFPF